MAPPTGLNLADLELAERARGGDHQAIAELYRQHRAALHRHACRMLYPDEAAAQDVVQEAFVRAIAAIGQTREQLNFRAWVFRIATNLCLRQLTQRLRVSANDELAETASEPAGEGASEEGLQREALGRALGAALDRLPPRYRQILILREVDELEYEELARVLELSLSNVKVTLHRARARFRALFLAEQYRRRRDLARCEDLLRLLALEEGEEVQRGVERHLETCRRCREDDRSTRQLLGLLPPIASAPPEAPPPVPPAGVGSAPLVGGSGAAAGGQAAVTGSGVRVAATGGAKLLGLAAVVGLGVAGIVLFTREPAPSAPVPSPRPVIAAAPRPTAPTLLSTAVPAASAPATAPVAIAASRPKPKASPASRPAAAPAAGGLRVKLELRAGTVHLDRAGRLEPLTAKSVLHARDRLRTEGGAWVALRFPGDQWLALRGRLELTDATGQGEKVFRRVEVRLLEGELRVKATARGGGMLVEAGAACARGRCARSCELGAGEARVRLLPGAVQVAALAGYLQVRGPHASRMLAAGSVVELADRPGFSEALLPAPRELRPVRASGPRPPLLRWEPVPGASGYRIRVGPEANLWLPEEDLVIREPSYQPRMAGPGRHFWQVVAVSGEREGAPSKIYAYVINP
jgi:RNA polymerase sigma-70 factor (ECF subfamily)